MTATITAKVQRTFTKGSPFSGDMVVERVQIMGDGTRIARPRRIYKMRRDSQGRTRTEIWEAPYQPGESGGFTLTEIHDPMEGFYYVLDEQNRVTHRVLLATLPSKGPPTVASSKARPERSSESLGAMDIEGIHAEGTKTTITFPVGAADDDRPYIEIQESWYSPELKMVVRSRFSDLARDDTTKLINVSRAEPEGSGFKPPAGYTIVNEEGSFKVIVKRQ